MNAEQLRTIIDFLLQEESKYRIQERLTTLCGEVSNLASAPSDRTHQTQVAAALSALEAATKSFAESVLPAKTKRIAELGGNNYFSAEILKRVRQSFAQNALMPAVVQQHLQARGRTADLPRRSPGSEEQPRGARYKSTSVDCW